MTDKNKIANLEKTLNELTKAYKKLSSNIIDEDHNFKNLPECQKDFLYEEFKKWLKMKKGLHIRSFINRKSIESVGSYLRLSDSFSIRLYIEYLKRYKTTKNLNCMAKIEVKNTATGHLFVTLS